MDEIWDYPAGPKTNVFGSNPDYDEARGPLNPTIGERFVRIDQVAAEVAEEEEESDEDY